MKSQNIASIDLGSGTIKLNVFALKDDGPVALELLEIDTQLRRGMGDEQTLKPEPVARTLEAAGQLQQRAAKFKPAVLAVYATSAVRRAKNPETLLRPLQQSLGLEAKVLSEAEEGRLNLYGALEGLKDGKVEGCVAVDPGGDSTDAAWTRTGRPQDWQGADVVSLPFGSVALIEQHGRGDPAAPIPPGVLEAARKAVFETLQKSKAALALKGLEPVIRMNEPMRLALARVAGASQKQARFPRDLAWQTALALAKAGHAGRAEMLAGEPEGKLDRTPYGYASWAGLLDYMEADSFGTDLWGIKWGAPLAAWRRQGPWADSA